MNRFYKILCASALLLAIAVLISRLYCIWNNDGLSGKDSVRLLYWNIQNGMWSEQGTNYDGFVKWVSEQNPDICVWCEAQTIFETGTDEYMEYKDMYLIENWGELAARYGHKYWYLGGYRDDYPQVITSKFPIHNIKPIIGAEPDSVVTHGAAWAQIVINNEPINIVTLHTWPQQWGYRSKDKEAGKASGEGDKYRLMEMEYICKHTIQSVPGAADQNWLMMGDFNARSRVDNYKYNYPDSSSKFLVHDYIKENTPYRDIIAEKYPGEFKTTIGREGRIDFVYCTTPMFNRITYADVITDEYTKPVRDPQKLSNFWHPSDHRPIIVDFDLR